MQLRGWRYQNGVSTKLTPDEQGRIWSVELNSWLVPDDNYVRLHDNKGRLRLTELQALEQITRLHQLGTVAAQAEQIKIAAEEFFLNKARLAREEAERQRQVEQQRAEQERLAREEAEKKLQVEQQRAEQERKAWEEAERLIAELRAKLENQQ